MDVKEAGRLGGKAALTKMTPEQRKERAKKASLAAAEARKKKSGDNLQHTQQPM